MSERVRNFGEYHDIIAALKGKGTIFRGLRRTDYDLLPRAGRHKPLSAESIPAMEKRLLRYFQESAIPHLGWIPRDEFEWLALAQHHGLPTRLMDWSYNPLVALFFAVEKPHEGESVVWIWEGGSPEGDAGQQDPFAIQKVRRYRPPHVSARITAQHGLFTAHGNPAEPFSHELLSRVEIAAEARRQIKQTLFKYGVSRRYLFPGLDGLASDLGWLETDVY